MEHYVGLDVSLKETHICVVDGAGAVVARQRSLTDPEAIAQALSRQAVPASTVVLETGGQSHWLCSGLVARDVPAVIVDARRAKAFLSSCLNKTDANDASGLAQLARTGLYRRVAVKRDETRVVRTLLLAREQLVKQRRDLENQVRGFLRGFGLRVSSVTPNHFEARVMALVAERVPELEAAVAPLLAARRGLLAEIKVLQGRIKARAADDAVCRRLMTAPGVGPMTALAFMTAIDDPARFRRSADVGAYLGLTPRRRQSGEMDRSGRISKWGDALARHMLYEAANVLLARVRRSSPLKAWAVRLSRRIGAKKARVALARKLAVILHRMWCDGTTFRWDDADGIDGIDGADAADGADR